MPFFNRDEVAQYLSGIQPGVPGWKGTMTAQRLKDMGQALLYTGDVGTGYKEPTLEGAANMALDIMPMSAVASMATKVPAGALGANVFHGGPHRWAPEPDFPHGRPRLDKMGTGEGAQAYGHGFYSADAPGVAESYKTSSKAWEFDGVPFADIDKEFPSPFHIGGDPEARRAAYLFDGYDSLDEAFKSQRYNIARHKAEGNVEIIKREENILQEMQELAPRISNTEGTLYKLDIPDADVAKYLDWDKPLGEQPKSVRDALANMFGEGKYLKYGKGRGDEIKDYTGRQLYEALKDPTGLMLTFPEGVGGSRKAASEALRKAGIPGLKYFDQGSRAGGEGTRNYVTWDQDVLNRSKMLERDGQDLAKALMEVEP